MKVKMLDTGTVVEYDDGYAARLIEQGKAVYVDGGTPITPTPDPIDPNEYGPMIVALQGRCAELETAMSKVQNESSEDHVFSSMAQSLEQAQARKLEYQADQIQEDLDTAAGNEE